MQGTTDTGDAGDVVRRSYQVTSSLASALLPCFGPLSLDIMIVTKTNTTIITNSGSSVLRAMNATHPLYTMLMQHSVKQSDREGDGSITSMLYTNALLGGIENFLSLHVYGRPSVSGSRARLHLTRIGREMQRQVSEVRTSVLPAVLATLGRPFKCDALDDVKRGSLLLVSSLFQGSLSPRVQGNLSSLLMEWIFTPLQEAPLPAHQLPSALDRVLSSIITNCPIVPSAGNAVDTSYVVGPGEYVLRKDYVRHQAALITELVDCKIVLMHCQIDDVPLSNTAVTVTDSGEYSRAVNYRALYVERLLECLWQRGVNVIITSERVPESALQISEKYKIRIIQFVEDGDLFHLASLGGVAPLEECSLENLRTATPMQAARMKRVVISNGPCVVLSGIVFRHLSSKQRSVPSGGGGPPPSPSPSPSQLVLCGSSEGMINQYKSLIIRGATAIRSWLSSAANNTLFLMPSGATFELFVHHHLHKKSLETTDQYSKLVLSLVAEAALEVPRALLASNHRKTAGVGRSEGLLASLVALHKEGRHNVGLFASVTAASMEEGFSFIHCDVAERGVYEPPCFKVGLLTSSMEMVAQLCRLETIKKLD